MDEKKLIQGAASLIAKSALSLFVNDRHRWSTRLVLLAGLYLN